MTLYNILPLSKKFYWKTELKDLHPTLNYIYFLSVV